MLSIVDDGVGIPPELREKVLERFFRIDASKGSGSGLGLAIVSEICERLQATLALRTPPGGVGLQVDVGFVPAP